MTATRTEVCTAFCTSSLFPLPDGVGDHHIGPQGDADDLPGRLNVGACFRPLSPPLQVSHALVWKRYAVLSKAAEVFLRQVSGG